MAVRNRKESLKGAGPGATSPRGPRDARAGKGPIERQPGPRVGLVPILFLAWGSVFLDRMAEVYLAPYFGAEFHLSNAQIGLLASVLSITWALASLGFGALSDRVGRRTLLIPAVFLFSIFSGLSGLAHSFGELLVIRALMGLAGGPCWSIMTALIEETSSPQRRGRNVGVVVSAAALVGLAAAPVLTTQIAAHFSWRWAFVAAGVPGMLMGVAIWVWVREPEREPGPVAGGHGRARAGDFVRILRYRNMWLACLAAACNMAWLFLQNVFAPLYITNVIHQSPTVAGFVLGATGLGSFFVGIAFPSISDRVGRKQALLMLAALSTVVPIALQIPALYQHLWLLAAIVFVTNGGQGVMALVVVLIPTESVPRELAGTAIGLSTLVGELLGATAAPTVAGALAERYGLAFPLWVAAGSMVLIFIIALGLEKRERPRLGEAIAAKAPKLTANI